jgi:hypothetical protein
LIRHINNKDFNGIIITGFQLLAGILVSEKYYYKYYLSGHYPSSCIYVKRRSVYILKHKLIYLTKNIIVGIALWATEQARK